MRCPLPRQPTASRQRLKSDSGQSCRCGGDPSLWHLLVWMTGCAVYFSLARRFLPRTARQSGPDAPAERTCALHGLCWTGAVVALIQSWAGIAAGRSSRGRGCCFRWGASWRSICWSSSCHASSCGACRIVAGGGTCLALALPTLSRRLPGWWKGFFVVLALLMAGKLVWLLASLTRGVTMPERSVGSLRAAAVGAGAAAVRDGGSSRSASAGNATDGSIGWASCVRSFGCGWSCGGPEDPFPTDVGGNGRAVRTSNGSEVRSRNPWA